MIVRYAMIGAAAMALAACGGSEETAESSELALQETPSLPADPTGVVRLRGDGLEITGPLGTMLTFGSPRATVEAELAAIFSEARDVGTNADCGAGPMAFTGYPGGLTLNFQEGALVGWSLRDDDGEGGSEGGGDGGGEGADIATAEGIALDSSEAELAAAYAVEMIADSTLGEEFTTPAGIFGFLAGEGAQKEVESLHAGTNCFFR